MTLYFGSSTCVIMYTVYICLYRPIFTRYWSISLRLSFLSVYLYVFLCVFACPCPCVWASPMWWPKINMSMQVRVTVLLCVYTCGCTPLTRRVAVLFSVTINYFRQRFRIDDVRKRRLGPLLPAADEFSAYKIDVHDKYPLWQQRGPSGIAFGGL